MDDVTRKIMAEAQRLSRGAAGDVPAAFSPLRGRTLTSTPGASTDKSFSDLLEEAAYGLSSQVRTGVTRLRGGDVNAVQREMAMDPSAGSYAATYRDLGVPGPAASVLGFATEVVEPGPGEISSLAVTLPTMIRLFKRKGAEMPAEIIRDILGDSAPSSAYPKSHAAYEAFAIDRDTILSEWIDTDYLPPEREWSEEQLEALLNLAEKVALEGGTPSSTAELAQLLYKSFDVPRSEVMGIPRGR